MNINDFVTKLKETQEGRKYLEIIDRGKLGDTRYERGFERHHILPKALGGTDNSSNLVKLSTLDHILAHIYLAKAVPCYDTVNSIDIMSGRQYSDLSDSEKDIVQEAKVWAGVRELSRRYRRPQSEETKRKFVEKSKVTRFKKYGGLMTQALAPEVIQKRLESTAKKYSGDSAGQLHTEASRCSRKASMVRKYGGCTKHMQAPEIIEKARQTRIKHAKQSQLIVGTEPFRAWFNSQKEIKYPFRGVSRFLKELGKTREEYLTSIDKI